MGEKTSLDKLSDIQKQHIADHVKYYKSLYEKHKGEWLTDVACMEYWERAKRLANQGNQDIGEKRKLREELQERYGLQEMEAINILDGIHSRDYVEKYKLIKAIQNMEDWIEPYLKNAKKASVDKNEES